VCFLLLFVIVTGVRIGIGILRFVFFFFFFLLVRSAAAAACALMF
jgi:hypothetical protein